MIEVWSDGSCSYNPGPGGFGVVSASNGKIDYSFSKQCENTTNNKEELKGLIHALKYCDIVHPKEECIIYCDSAYCVNMCNDWIWKWSKNSWCNSKNKQVENLDLVKEIYNYINKENYHCQIIKVSAHTGNIFNEVADALATGNHNKLLKLKEKHNLT